MCNVSVTSKTVNLGDNEGQKVPCLLKVAGKKNALEFWKSSCLLFISQLGSQLITVLIFDHLFTNILPFISLYLRSKGRLCQYGAKMHIPICMQIAYKNVEVEIRVHFYG